MTFRFDDVCINTDPVTFVELVNVIRFHVPHAHFLFAISPIVFSPEQLATQGTRDPQRVHPRVLTAQSSLTAYFRGNTLGLPHPMITALAGWPNVRTAGHGIVHVDHRLLSEETQELSIVTSCSIAQSKVFVPPYNKWNESTRRVCERHDIELIKFESGWQHVLYNQFDSLSPTGLYYLHPYDISADALSDWFNHDRAEEVRR